MALPRHLQTTFLPSELSFMAESELISIVPRQALDAIPLISGTMPRMRPPARASVPIWLAILLKRQKRATLITPDWLSVDALTAALEEERQVDASGQPAGFSAVPFRWIEVSDLILDAAPDDVADVDTVRRLLRDLREMRQAKARDGLDEIDGRILHMDNIGATEVNEIRGVFGGTMDLLRRLHDTKAEADDDDAGGDDDMASDDSSDG